VTDQSLCHMYGGRQQMNHSVTCRARPAAYAPLLATLLHTHTYGPLLVTFFVVELCHRLSFLVSTHIRGVLLGVLGKRQQCLACTPHPSRHTSTTICPPKHKVGATCAQCDVPLVFRALAAQIWCNVPKHPTLGTFPTTSHPPQHLAARGAYRQRSSDRDHP